MKLWLLWVLSSILAFGIGGRLGGALSPSRDIIVIGYTAVMGSLILAGVLQWLILRRLIADSGAWIQMNVAAVAIIGVIVFGLGLFNRDFGWVLGVIAGLVLLGVLQSLVLREQVSGAGWWILANALGLCAAILVVAVTTWVTDTQSENEVGAFLRWSSFGAAYGIVTATALVWLLRHKL